MIHIDPAQVFEINNCTPQVIDIDQHRRLVRVQDFYTRPERILELAHNIPLSCDPTVTGDFPSTPGSGRINCSLNLSHMSRPLATILEPLLHRRPREHVEHCCTSASFMVNSLVTTGLEPQNPHQDHPDPELFAITIGLTPPQQCRGGTAFYTQLAHTEPTHYVTDSTAAWQLDYIAELEWNTLWAYSTSYWHTAYAQPNDFPDPQQPRLTQQFFV